jgi:hypothetical protein
MMAVLDAHPFHSLLGYFRFELGPNGGGVLAEGLTGLVTGFLIANIPPDVRFGILRQKSALWIHLANFLDDGVGNEPLFPLEAGRQVNPLASLH